MIIFLIEIKYVDQLNVLFAKLINEHTQFTECKFKTKL